MKMRLIHVVLMIASLLICGLSVMAGELGTPQQRDLFENHVRPMLVKQCIECHGDAKQEAGLRLTSMESLLQGGESGPAIVPGKPDESLLIEALRYESFEMPPTGRLDDQVVNSIAAWIKAGSLWPQGLVLKSTPKITENDRDWWCYQPIADSAVPDVDDNGWCRNEIDRFILARLEREGLAPSEQADASKLARRVHFAVTGLPPTPDVANSILVSRTQLETRRTSEGFVSDPTLTNQVSKEDQLLLALPAAPEESAWYETLVDRLLNGSAYGENQARYWLDLVRYADSDGYNADHARPEAHHYRDYVIRSFNEDKPYDRFVIEQLAGDEVDPGDRDALIGTMYLRHWIYEHNQRDVEGQWAQILSDVTETTADVFLAQGVKCARCHDHKFDPLLQRDYYAMRAFFTPLTPREDQPIADVETRVRYLEKERVWESATEEIRKRLHEIETPELLAHATREGVHRFTKEIQAMVNSRRHELSPYENQIATLASKQFDVLPDKLPEWLDEAEEAERQQLLAKLAEFDDLKPKPLPTLKFVASDVGPIAPPTFIPDVADQTPMEPAFPVILEYGPATITPLPDALQSTGRRTALAKWIVSNDNPLTARVIVNRVWQQHFGRGLVETASDFGRLGTPPSHPELLDWLARRFIADGWSFKKLHRLILTSATYRQSSERPLDQKLAKLDPQNALLWRMNVRRLSGEEIHDCVLSASGEMSQGKRAIYKTVKRNSLDPLLAAFDFPDRVESQGERHRTTTSPQALLVMNDPWWHDRAKVMASQASSDSIDSLVWAAYQKLYFREPTGDEVQQAKQFFEAYAALTPKPERPKRLAELPDGRPAISLNPKQPASIQIPAIKELQADSGGGDFTIEATVMLRSLYPDANVRTIAASWSGKQSEPGWSLGVTSTKSAFKPRNLILQLIGSRDNKDSQPEYEVIASDLRVELNKPYNVAVAINLDDASAEGITFYLRDLSKPDSKLQTARVAHHARWNVQSERPVEIGGRSNRHRWDGLIQNVRLHRAAISRDELFADKSNTQRQSVDETASRLLFDLQFASEGELGRDQSGQDRHATVGFSDAAMTSPQEHARAVLLHTFFCSNGMIYVD